MLLIVEETKETIIAFGRLISRSGKVKYPILLIHKCVTVVLIYKYIIG